MKRINLLRKWQSENKLWYRIAVISFISLFLELLVIRVISTEIRIFAYLANLVLLATFVGSGLGMVSRRKLDLWVSQISLMVLVLVLAMKYIVRLPNLEFNLFSGITELLTPLSESYIWLQLETYSKSGVIIGLLLTLLLFLLVVVIFYPLGSYLGSLLNQTKKPLAAYSINVVFSLLGMWVFALMSYIGISPFFGLFGCMLLFWPLLTDQQSKIYSLIAVVAVAVVLLPNSGKQPYEEPVTFWSPYQKLTLSLINKGKPHQAEGWYLEVNNVGYMGLLDLSPEATEERAEILTSAFGGVEQARWGNQYDFPYRLKPEPKRVLIIGGGAGNDAAAALRANASKVDLVEIDPQIVRLGRKYHPEKPYSDIRVQVTVDDGRAFLERAKTGYDLIVMGLADSHTGSSSMTNVQLDNYLYTLESLSRAKQLLADDGLLVLTFEVPRPWVGQRLSKTVTTAFGHEPKVFEVRSDGAFGWGGIFFVTGKRPEVLNQILAEKPDVAAYIQDHQTGYQSGDINLLRDNWPYLYLDKPRIPVLHLVVALIISSIILLSRQAVVGKGKINWPFFALGAGFMVFEFQNISKASLLFGNTWMTNMFIITGVLGLILGANLATAKKWLTFPQAVMLMFVSLGLQLLVPYSIFNQLEGITKLILSIPFLTLPHFFSGLIFAQLFKREKDKAAALGSNLLGSAIGGFLEVLSYLIGMSGLIWVTILLYGVGIAKLRKQKG